MLTSEGCAARRRKLWESLPVPCDAVILSTTESLAYFANYVPSPFVFNVVESGAVLVMRPDRSILVGDNLLGPFLERSCVDEVVCREWYTGTSSAVPRRGLIAGELVAHLPSRAGCRLGVESLGPGPIDPENQLLLDSLIRSLRRTKHPDELALIRRSVGVGEAGHAAALAGIEPGMTELDAFLLVQAAVMRSAGEQVSIYGDFVSGPRCETERGGPPGLRVIERGDLFLLDYSVVVHGYRADFTNTFVIGAEPTPKQTELFNICMGALAAGESQLRPGVPARHVDAAVRGHFASHGLEASFPSHSGHGLGLGHPEPPYLVPDSTDTLQDHDVVALEPGLYVPGVGGMRFERNYLITAESHDTLTRHRLGLTR